MKNTGGTVDVKSMYEAYPYPSPTAGTGLIYDLANLLASVYPDDDLSGRKILDAGCGTGQRIVGVATRYRQAQVLGLDMTAASLAAARELARKKSVTNVRFQEANLLALDLDEQFDVITATGVVHHLADPALGLKNLCARLSRDGLISLWHYHPLGEHERLLQRELLLTLWGGDRADLSAGISLMNALGLNLSSKQYGSTAAQRAGAPDQVAIDVDAYLHPIVNAYRFEEAIDLFSGCGVDWIAVNGVNLPDASKLIDLDEVATEEEAPLCVNGATLFDSPQLVERYRALDKRGRLAVIELVLRCTGFTIMAGRGDSYRKVAPRVRGNVISAMAP